MTGHDLLVGLADSLGERFDRDLAAVVEAAHRLADARAGLVDGEDTGAVRALSDALLDAALSGGFYAAACDEAVRCHPMVERIRHMLTELPQLEAVAS